MRKLRFTLALLSVGAVFGLLAVTASATSGAHFMRDTSASVSSSGALSVYIDEAGVGNADVSYSITWHATAQYGCFNNGGNHPKASNKETVNADGAASATLKPINGRIQATVPIDGTPPGAGSFTCPSGQTLELISVSYNPVVINDLTNGVSTTVSA
jgi:hypothetical protein